MHPVTAILGLILLTGSLAWGQWSLLAAASAVVVLLYTSTRGQRVPRGLLRRLRRLRWLFLTIVVIYGWLTPGLPVWQPLGHFSPTATGLVQGMLRCLNLVVILAAVHWLLSRLDRESLVSGLYWIARPVVSLGLRPETLAVRLVLTLEYLDQVEAARPNIKTIERGRTLDRVAEWFLAVLEPAAGRGPAVMDLSVVAAPKARDWLVLLALLTGLVWVGIRFSI